VSGTWKKYADGGISAVKAVKMGRPRDRGALSPAQQQQIRKAIVDKRPEQLKLKGFLWDREGVRDLIRRRYGVKISVQAVGSYLKKWGFSPQRPVIRNYKQNPSEIREWLDVKYPAIKKRAKKENGEIMWCDETGCQNETNYVKGYAPAGKTPVLPSGDHRLRVSMISAITNQGKLRFMFYRESMNARLLIKFLDRLIREARRKIFLVLDNLKAHHAAVVREWLETRKKKIELFFLPPYAPEYNPDEYLNGELKRSLAKKGYSVTAAELESKARNTMKNIQCDPAHIANFFKAEPVRYAA
jgi:transposase